MGRKFFVGGNWKCVNYRFLLLLSLHLISLPNPNRIVLPFQMDDPNGFCPWKVDRHRPFVGRGSDSQPLFGLGDFVGHRSPTYVLINQNRSFHMDPSMEELARTSFQTECHPPLDLTCVNPTVRITFIEVKLGQCL